ncbi:MAG: ChaN family lipoprotein [Verrucomicrobiales bacterium]
MIKRQSLIILLSCALAFFFNACSHWTPAGPIVYLPERHGDPTDHARQQAALHRLIPAKPLIGMEMFTRDQQNHLNAWQQGRIGLDRLFARTNFNAAWQTFGLGYRQILTIAEQNEIPVLALNAPRSVTSPVARGQEVPSELRHYLRHGFRKPPGGFQNFATLLPAEHMGQEALRRYYEAMFIWDATMARALIDSAWRGPTLVLLGRGHASPKFGVPALVHRAKPRRPQWVWDESGFRRISDRFTGTNRAPHRR